MNAGAPPNTDHADWRHLDNGREIPISEGYADQPFVVVADDGAWVCLLTTGPGEEGATGQHVVSARSLDQGKTWIDRVDVEPADIGETSYAAPVKAASGRLYALYNFNHDNVRRMAVPDPAHRDSYTRDGFTYRVDCLGSFVFKYSDDHGRTWSAERFTVPVRKMKIDRENITGGEVMFFWNASRILTTALGVYVPLYKVGNFGKGFYTSTQGVLLHSPNLLDEPDPAKIRWETLPEGDTGICSPQPGGGLIAEEHSFSVLSDGSLYDVFRTTDGQAACTYSRDGGRNWSAPRWKTYPDGRAVKNPRAANFAWKCGDGRFLYWFENHGRKSYDLRNPAWVLGGVEADSPEGRFIRWSQPEVLLYHDNPLVRMSYPDLIEDDGRVFITETKKDIARIHEIPAGFLETLWSQFDPPTPATDGLLLDQALAPTGPTGLDWPELPKFAGSDRQRIDGALARHRTGFTFEMMLRPGVLGADRVLLDTFTDHDAGLRLTLEATGRLRLDLGDGLTRGVWCSDPGLLHPDREHHVGVVVDGGPGLIAFVIDGVFNDGGEHRPFGWGRFSPHLRHANGHPRAAVNTSEAGGHRLSALKVYGRALMTAELVNHHRLR